MPVSWAIFYPELLQAFENSASKTHLKQLFARDCLLCEAHQGGWYFKCYQWSFENSRLSCLYATLAFLFGCVFVAKSLSAYPFDCFQISLFAKLISFYRHRRQVKSKVRDRCGDQESYVQAKSGLPGIHLASRHFSGYKNCLLEIC